MRIRITIGGDDWTDRCIISETQIETGSDGAVSSATLRVSVEGVDAAYYDAAFYGTASYDGVELPTLALVPVIIEEADVSPPNVIFRGEVVRGKKETLRTGFAMWRLECAGFERVLDETSLTNTWANKSDQVIIQEAFAAEAPEISVTSATIDEIQTNLYLDATDFTLRDVLEAMQSVSGARICLTPDRVLYYSLDSSATIPAAPFDIDVEFPDEVTTLSPIGSLTPDTIDFTKIANHVTVIGGYKDGGTRATGLAQDVTSQTEYGTRKRVLVENSLLTNDLCQARAEAELLQWSNPQRYGQFVVRQDGLRAGQKIHITARGLKVDSDFVIRRLSMSWESDSETVYRADYGFYDPRLDLLLAKIARGENRQKKGTILALPPADSVATLHIKALAVTDAKIDTLTVSKLTAGTASFSSVTVLSYGSSKLSLNSTSIRLESDSTRYLQASATQVAIVNGAEQLTLDGTGINIASSSGSGGKAEFTASKVRISGTSSGAYGEFTATGIDLIAGSVGTKISAGGIQLYGGSAGIGIGASSFASSPMRITAAGIEMGIGDISLEITSTFANFVYDGGSAGISISASGLGVFGGFSMSGGDLELLGLLGPGNGDVKIPAIAGYYVGGNKVIGARGAAVADATGAGDVVAQLNALLARCRAHGLIGT